MGQRRLHRLRHRRIRADPAAAHGMGITRPRPVRGPGRGLGVGEEASMRRALLLGIAVVTGLLAFALPAPRGRRGPDLHRAGGGRGGRRPGGHRLVLPVAGRRRHQGRVADAGDDDVDRRRDHHAQRGPQRRARPSSCSATPGPRRSRSRSGSLVRRGPSPAYVEFSAGPAAVSAIVTEDLADGSRPWWPATGAPRRYPSSGSSPEEPPGRAAVDPAPVQPVPRPGQGHRHRAPASSARSASSTWPPSTCPAGRGSPSTSTSWCR